MRIGGGRFIRLRSRITKEATSADVFTNYTAQSERRFVPSWYILVKNPLKQASYRCALSLQRHSGVLRR